MLKKLLAIMLALFTAMPSMVKADEEERIILKQEEYIIEGMQTFLIEYELYPETLDHKDLKVNIDGSAIAMYSADEGALKFQTDHPGTSTVTISTPNGATATVKVTVNDVTAEGIAFEKPEYTLGVNSVIELHMYTQPEYAFYTIEQAVVSDDSAIKVEGVYFGTVLLRILKEGDFTIALTIDNRKGEKYTAEAVIHSVFKPVENIRIPIDQFTAVPGNLSVVYRLEPLDTSERTVSVTSSNPEVVQVPETTDNPIFNVRLLKEGEADITITAANGATGTIHITVKAEEVKVMRWQQDERVIALGGTAGTMLLLTPTNGSVEGIVFTSSDEEVADVTMMIGTIAMVEGRKEGTADITAALPNGLSAVLHVTVKYIEPERLTRYDEEVTINGKGQTVSINHITEPSGFSPTGITVSSDNPEVAETYTEQYKWCVTSGKPGIANVTMTLPNGNAYTTKVIVNEVRAEEIAFAEESIVIREDETGIAAYTYGPENANGEITVTVDDPSVAEIIEAADGSITLKGLQAGTTTLTVEADENVKDTIAIVVEENPDKDPAACTVFGFCEYEGRMYWYEEGKRQGVYGDEKNITDILFNIERGREIYDPETDAWYWLDAVNDGAAAVEKEVWIPYIFQGEDPATEGKWVRYDDHGQMVKGWYACEAGVYYYDKLTGAMYKGAHEIEGKTYFFDELTGIRQ